MFGINMIYVFIILKFIAIFVSIGMFSIEALLCYYGLLPFCQVFGLYFCFITISYTFLFLINILLPCISICFV